MLRSGRALTTVLVAFVSVGCASVPPAPVFRIGIIGDQTLASDLDAAYGVLEKAVARLQRENVRVVLHTGDLVESSLSTEDYRAAYARASGILNRFPSRWYMTAGDHDVNPPPPFARDSADRSRETLFRELYGATRPEARDRLYYSFDVGGYHFVVLYSGEALNADPRWGVILLAGLSETQRQWLVADLETHRDVKGTVVLIHQPLWYNWTRWNAVHQILRRYGVSAVIAGHFHYNQDDGALDGIRYVVVGAAGGRVKHGSARAGNLHHVTVMTLRGRDATFTVLPVDGGAATDLTPRADMDRVQMLDVVLGGLWDFEAKNRVFMKNSALVSSCDAPAPARIEIAGVGNPLDVPLTVTVRFAPPGTDVSDSAFGQNVCEPGGSADRCVLRRGARIGVANLSSVDMAFDAPALWAGFPRVSGPNVPAPGTPLSVDLRLAFEGTSGVLYLERRLTTHILACPQ